jgi:hypothetical protein
LTLCGLSKRKGALVVATPQGLRSDDASCYQSSTKVGYFKNQRRDAWNHLKAGLLRALSGCTQREIGLRGDRHNSTICRYLQEHQVLMRRVPAYELLHAKISDDVLELMRTTARVAAR